MKFWSKLCYVAFLALLINSTYKISFGEPTKFYIANGLIHILLGVALIIPFVLYACRHFTALTAVGKSAVVLLGLGAVSGGFLMKVGATTPYRWLLTLHIITVTLGTILFIGDLFYRSRLHAATIQFKKAANTGVVVLGIVLLFPFAARIVQHYLPNPDYLVQNPLSPPTSMYEEGGGTDGPFFPGSVETFSGDIIPTDFFLTSDSCAESGCHPDIYEQWNESAHHFASFNNQWYRKSIMYMQDMNGIQPSKWCGGCHDPAILLNGVMDFPIRKNLHTPAAQAGLSCTACHSMEKVKDTMGNNGYIIKYPPLHDIAASDNPIVRKLHNYLIRLDPEPHKKSFLKPFHRENTAEFCSTCHKVHLDEPVNNFRWFRGFNDYDQWQSSGVSHQGALSFYYPEKAKKCTDCHMPLVASNDAGNINGKVHNHRFPGANTALPLVNKHDEQLKLVTEFLQDNQVTVDIFALSPATPIQIYGDPGAAGGPSVFSMTGEESDKGRAVGTVTDIAKIIAPIDQSNAAVNRGDSVRVDVVVRTRGVGHRFPAGTIDAFDVWVELKATDENGKILFWSGMIEAEDGNGPVDESAHFYRAYMLDEHGNLINKRNAWATRTVLYARTIPPGAADTVHYRISIPDDCGDKIYLHAKLNYRKFNWWHTQWAYAGVRDPDDTDYKFGKGYDDGRWVFTGDTSDVAGKIKAIPNLPIVVMAEDTASLNVIDADAAPPEPQIIAGENDRERWNDYGIGLFLQGDLKGAEAVFKKVTEIDSEYLDGWVNIARCRIREGNMSGANEVLNKAFEIQQNLPPENPHRAKVHYFYALVKKAYGDYDDAIHQLRLAAAQFPRDRKVRNEIGRLLYLQRKYEDALVEFQKTVEVNPEDLDAHYNMMLCYRALKNQVMAAKEEKLYRRFKEDEAVESITGPVRRTNPFANIERQQIHEHTSAWKSGAAGY